MSTAIVIMVVTVFRISTRSTVFNLACNNIDDTGHGILTVNSRPWSFQDLNSLDVLQIDWQIHIVMPGLRITHADTVNQNQCLFKGTAADCDIGLNAMRTALTYVHTAHGFQKIGNTVHRQCLDFFSTDDRYGLADF